MIFLTNQLQRFGRAFRIWTILLGLLFYLWFDSKKWTYLKGYTTEGREKRNTLRAKWVTKELVDLGSAFIKLGQLLSARADVIPSSWVNELTSLQDRVPAFEFQKVKEILIHELGNSYENIINIDADPIGSASLAQVHKAKLNNDKTVWKAHALLLLGDFYFSKEELLKAKDFYTQVLLIKNLQKDFYKHANSKLALIADE